MGLKLRMKTLVTIAAVVAVAIFYSVLLGQNRSGAISRSAERRGPDYRSIISRCASQIFAWRSTEAQYA
jgi:preprotein translocase subunit SecG